MVGTTMVRAVREVASILAFGTPRVGLFGPGDIPKEIPIPLKEGICLKA